MTATTTRPTATRTAAPKRATAKKAAPKKTAPKAARPTVVPDPVAPAPAAAASGGNALSGAYKKSMGFMEGTVTGVLSLPLTVVSTLGVPSEATDVAKGGQQMLTKGFSGAFDGVVTSVAGLAGKAPGFVGGMMGSAAKLLP